MFVFLFDWGIGSPCSSISNAAGMVAASTLFFPERNLQQKHVIKFEPPSLRIFGAKK